MKFRLTERARCPCWPVNKKPACWGWHGLVVVMLACQSVPAATPVIPWRYARGYDNTAQKITFAGNATGLFRVGEKVGIQVADGSPLCLYNHHGTLVYSGSVTNLTWNPGYYFVESQTDRSAFVVLPAGYAGLPDVGNDAECSLTSDYEHNAAAAGVGWTRFFAYWSTLTNTNMTWGEYDFSQLDAALNYAVDTKRKLFVQLAFWPRYLTYSAQKTTARYIQFVDDVSHHIASHSNGTVCAAITPWNEPYGGSGSLLAEVKDEQLAEIYRQGVPILRRNLPRAMIVGGNNMDFGYAFGMLGKLKSAGGFVAPFDAMGHHYYDCVGRVDEPVFYGATFDEKLTKLRGFLQPTAPLFLDEIAVFGSRLTAGAERDVLGFAYVGNDQMKLGEHLCADWYDALCDEIKKAAIYRKHAAIVIGHNAFRGSHDARSWNGIYDGWFPGVRNGTIEQTRGPRPGLAVFLAANHWLGGGKFLSAELTPQGIHLYHFQRPDGTRLAFAWCVRGATAVLPRGTESRRTDVFGTGIPTTTITQEPVLLHFPPSLTAP